MSTKTRFIQAGVAVGTIAVLSGGIALACHPQGKITKDVQNLTLGGQMQAADTVGTAVTARPGDTLVYRITVANDAKGSQDQMINNVVTDQLPAGLQLVSADSFTLGAISMGQKKTVTVTAKVTAKVGGSIKNQACYSGDSTDHKVPQKGCDLAYVNIVVPTPTPTSTPVPTPSPTPTPVGGKGEVLSTKTEQPTTLPQTGTADLLGATTGMGAMVTALVAYRRSRKSVR